jgi:uncharacterized protein YhbP (UPF0306 family)
LRRRVERFLAERASMALATQGPEGLWVASVYFAGALDALYFLSSPASRHGRNLSANSRIAAAINEDEHEWRLIRGVQLEGTCELADSPAEWLRGWRAYLAKFPVRDVVDQLARPEKATEHRIHGAQLLQFAGARGREGLAQENKAFVHPIGHDEHSAQARQGLELDVRILVATPDRDRLSQQALTQVRI